MTLRKILERREAIRSELRTINEAAGDSPLAADAQARWTALEAEATQLTGAEHRQSVVDDLDRRGATPGTFLSDDPRFSELRAGIGLLDVVRAQLPEFASDRRSGVVREASQHISKMTGRTPTAGGLIWDTGAETRTTNTGGQGTPGNAASLVPTILDSSLFIDRLRNALVTMRLGATMITSLVGNVDVSRRSASVTAGFVQEGQNVPTSDASFDRTSFRPKTLGGVSILSRNAVIQTSPDIQALTEADFARVVAEAWEQAALTGAGGTYAPTGIVPIATAKTYLKANPTPTWADVLGCLGAADIANVVPSGWVQAGGMRSALMGSPKSGTLSLGYIQSDLNSLAGLPAVPSNLLPAGMLLLGDFSSLILATWAGGLELAANMWADSVYSSGSVAVRVLLTCDAQIRHNASFIALTQSLT